MQTTESGNHREEQTAEAGRELANASSEIRERVETFWRCPRCDHIALRAKWFDCGECWQRRKLIDITDSCAAGFKCPTCHECIGEHHRIEELRK
jgi:hypothetical protein